MTYSNFDPVIRGYGKLQNVRQQKYHVTNKFALRESRRQCMAYSQLWHLHAMRRRRTIRKLRRASRATRAL